MPLPFKPSFWPTIITIPCLIVMIGLSIWQIERLQWKNKLIAGREDRLAAAPARLEEAQADPISLEYRRIRLFGEFLHDKELYLAARSLESIPGYHIITPFRTQAGTTILIDRGFVPIDKKNPSDRPEAQIGTEQEIEGILRLPRPKAWMQPENETGKNIWFYMDPIAMAKATDLPNMVTGFYLDADATPNPGGWPKGGQTRINLPNDHLQYAITWALLAIALMVIYIVYHMKQKDEGRK